MKKSITTYEEKFLALQNMVKVVASKSAHSLIVLGEGGTGKTHKTLDTLDKLSINYLHFKGYTSNVAMYNFIFINRDRLIVFDDCDSVFKDAISINILKSVLDTYEERIVNWGSTSPLIEVNSFTFTGQIIFISNYDQSRMTKHFDALMTRTLVVDMNLSHDQKLRHMRSVARDTPYKKIDKKKRLEAFRFVRDNQGIIRNLNLRTLFQVLDIMSYDKKNWRRNTRLLWKSQST